MELSGTLIRRPVRITLSSTTFGWQKSILSSTAKKVSVFGCHSVRFLHCVGNNALVAAVNSSLPAMASNSSHDDEVTRNSSGKVEAIEDGIEKVIYRCRFMASLGVLGSLIGSFLCFIKGCTLVTESFMQYFAQRSRVIMWLIEAIDVYLVGTVMLVFGMGLYELFVSNLGSAESQPDQEPPHRSNLFGLFTLKERPKWLDIKTVNELKTKLGHFIVMLLLIGLFDKSENMSTIDYHGILQSQPLNFLRCNLSYRRDGTVGLL